MTDRQHAHLARAGAVSRARRRGPSRHLRAARLARAHAYLPVRRAPDAVAAGRATVLLASAHASCIRFGGSHA